MKEFCWLADGGLYGVSGRCHFFFGFMEGFRCGEVFSLNKLQQSRFSGIEKAADELFPLAAFL
jgi:hypothetical protein